MHRRRCDERRWRRRVLFLVRSRPIGTIDAFVRAPDRFAGFRNRPLVRAGEAFEGVEGHAAANDVLYADKTDGPATRTGCFSWQDEGDGMAGGSSSQKVTARKR
jgi:hypothetical protein